MKVGILKLGGRINMSGRKMGIGNGETFSMCKLLKAAGCEIHIYTKILSGDTLSPDFVWHNIMDNLDTSDVEKLFIINGITDFFGGAEQAHFVNYFHLINNFKGQVFYTMFDPEIPLKQIWSNISKKAWGSKYKQEDIEVTRDDIIVLSQCRDLKELERRYTKKAGNKITPIKKFVFFPFEVRVAMENEQQLPNPAPVVDILYGAGSTRGGRRSAKMVEWFYGMPDDVTAEIFGNITHDDIKKHLKTDDEALEKPFPTFSESVDYSKFTEKLQSGFSTLVIGDDSYESLNLVPQRAYESILAGNVVFVDAKMDIDRIIHPGGKSRELLYVSSQAELIENVKLIKADPSIHATIIDEQARSLANKMNTFVAEFEEFLKVAET